MTETPNLSVLERRPTTTKLLAGLTALIAEHESTTWHVELGRIPTVDLTDGTRKVADAPFMVLTPAYASSLEGTWTDPDADADWYYDLTIVGKIVDQVELARDWVRLWFLGRVGGAFLNDLDTEHVSVMNRRISDDTGIPEEKVPQSQLRLVLTVTPSS